MSARWMLGVVGGVGVAVAVLDAQSPFPTAGMPDQPVVVRTAAAIVKVSAIKGLVYPWALTFLPDGDMLVTEQNKSTLRRISKGTLVPTPITGLPQGITSTRRDTAGVDIVAHPRFAENHLIYVAYWKPKPNDRDIRVASVVRARYEGQPALQDVKEIWTSDSWTDGPSAARLVFGRDGKLYVGIGTPGFNEREGSAAAAQEPGSHLGKILRLNDDGTVPMDNPFIGKKGYKPEIFALGIRNAIGLAVHPETGEIWETENGPQGGDEINIIRRGMNYGWPIVTYGRAYTSDPEGKKSGLPPPNVQPPTAMEGMVEPVTFYKPSIAIAGLIFYTGDKFPLWRGNLIAGALVGMQLTRVQFNRQGLETRREAMLTELRQRTRDVRQGPDGLIYATTDMPEGAVLKLEPVTEP
ncbi:MAG: PQQ-dependent sugar dehydrogenase [Acidimicrobiia bacterium]|nr:PQQ-dependent sugar dehydrogenase [Acidimicrobiia bacterium]